MIKHIVMWKLKEEAQGNSKEVNGQKIKQKLEGLMGKVEGLQKVEVGLNFNPGGYDVCLYSEFGDRAALDYYINHPLHKRNQAFTLSVVCERAVADYEV